MLFQKNHITQQPEMNLKKNKDSMNELEGIGKKFIKP